MELLEGLNDSQREAVTTTEGYVRVIAGAGSGKTRALSRRFAYLVMGLGIMPGHILCVTFTNKSANEMRQRIHYLTGDNDTGYINTFHGFCVSVLQEDSSAVSYPKSFLVLDNSDIDDILDIIYEERHLSMRDMTYSNARDMFEIMKIKERPDYYLDMISMSIDELKEKYDRATEVKDILFYGYLYQEKKCFGLDYNDLIKFTLYIFQQNEEIKLKWQKRLEYIMIDEFQDIDGLQYELMEVLSAYHKNLFIVGDPDQTIYTWRGANVKYLLDFDKGHKNLKTIMMNDNYRSTPQILSAVNSLIDKNTQRIKKELTAVLPAGDSVLCHMAPNTTDEADWITGQMLVLKGMGVSYKDMTVLYRAHYVTRTIEEGLIREKIPYTIYSGVQFFGRLEIKDALCYLRMVVYKDDISFRRIVNVPKRNIGKRRMAFLEEYAAEHRCSLYTALNDNIDNELIRGTGAKGFISLIEEFAENYQGEAVSEVLTKILQKSGYEEMLRKEGAQDRLDNLAELKQSVFEYETTCGEEIGLEDYLKHIALFTNADAEAGSEDKVRLMTVHAAKGLEFPYVFLCGMNEGIFPSRKIHTLEGMEEERRLAFVAMTRAQRRLFISEAGGRNFEGIPRYPSRFILDIDEDKLEFTEKPDEAMLTNVRKFIENDSRHLKGAMKLNVMEPGTRVEHSIFGAGIIVDVNYEEESYTVQFDEMDTPRQISCKVRLNKLEG
ncbi:MULTISPECIES: ATP-dependent helicase [unclassified Butyrivibrio]|uniref:ATP-dependent helicase n=1 Tax=unclassified Butyrivibrio TaxID=2639466 RepID=UPI0003B5E0F6|nr:MULTISPECIES: 3'-5' exonuclease [unclassified Butyrivibrio]MDC7294215.1 UvrD-helicase domain-containing protein [Butyrivibrio sp. DSM 10294]